MELKEDVVPKTAKNFKELAESKQAGNGYKGSRAHRIIPGRKCMEFPGVLVAMMIICTIAFVCHCSQWLEDHSSMESFFLCRVHGASRGELSMQMLARSQISCMLSRTSVPIHLST